MSNASLRETPRKRRGKFPKRTKVWREPRRKRRGKFPDVAYQAKTSCVWRKPARKRRGKFPKLPDSKGSHHARDEGSFQNFLRLEGASTQETSSVFSSKPPVGNFPRLGSHHARDEGSFQNFPTQRGASTWLFLWLWQWHG